jgi:chemotaxis protein histidine kinase CheA
MDVVKTNIARMAGLIEVDSEPGHGTRMIITLPITLAIIQALVIRSAGRTYAIPLNSVMESLMLDYSQIRTIERREVITLRDQTLPLVRLDRHLWPTADRWRPPRPPRATSSSSRWPITAWACWSMTGGSAGHRYQVARQDAAGHPRHRRRD